MTATPCYRLRTYLAHRRVRVLFGAFAIAAAEALACSPAISEQSASKWGLRAANAPDESVAIETAAARELPAVTAIDIQKAGTKTRVTLKLSGPVDASSYLLANPERAIVDLPEVAFRLDPGAGTGRKTGLAVSGYRFGLLEAGKSRVVLDLAAPARISSSALETADGAHRYVVEFEPVSRDAFAAAVQSTARPAPGASPVARAPAGTSDGLPVIVLDPGHGGIDAGARGAAQAHEKEVVLAFALTLGKKLEETGHYKVIFTRNDDVFIALPERVRIAREAGAKLFISIHADTLNERWVEGATVYTVSDKASDIHAARLAEKENQSDKLAGVEAGEETGEVSDILFDLTRRETRTFSHYFARSLVSYWKGAGKLNKNPIRSAGFRVLMAPDVPSVLLELGYLSSKTEAAKLSQPEWRATAAAAVARSVDSFFKPQAAQTEGLASEGADVAKESTPPPNSGVASAIR